jgi:hypothetical protein
MYFTGLTFVESISQWSRIKLTAFDAGVWVGYGCQKDQVQEKLLAAGSHLKLELEDIH